MIYKFNFFDLIPYFLLITIIIWVGNNRIKNVDSAKLICWIMIIFSAIRVGVGYDYYAYRRMILGDASDFSVQRLEFLSQSLIEFSSGIHYQIFYIITSFLIIYPLYLIVKKFSVDPSLSIITYALFPIFFLESFSIIRNAVAYTLVFWAYSFFIKKRYFPFILLSIAAFGFHKTAIIGILFLPLIYIFQNGRKINFIFLLVSFFSSYLIVAVISFLATKFPFFLGVERYAISGKLGAGNTMMIIINFIGILNILYWNRLVKINEYNKLWLNIISFGVVIWNIFGFEGTLRLRLSSFFLIFLILLSPSYIYIFKERYKKLSKQLIYMFLLLLVSASFYINISAHLKDNGRISFLPYQTIFYFVEYPTYVNE